MSGKSILPVLLALFAALSPLQARATVTINVQKASEFINAGDHRSAAVLLEEAVTDDPQHAEAKFLLGLCLLHMGDLERADGLFADSEKLDPSNVNRVERAFSLYVLERLIDGDLLMAQRAFDTGIRHQPGIRVQVSRACVDRAEEFLQSGKSRVAQELFQFASVRDPSLRDKICDVLFARARASTGEESLRYVMAAMRYGDKYQEETSKMVLHLANQVPDDDRRAAYLRQVEDKIPAERIFRSSIDYYSLKWGMPEKLSVEDPARWIAFTKGKERKVVRYLSMEHILTRGESGPVNLEPAVFAAGVFSGQEVPVEGEYAAQVWVTMDNRPAEVYLWALD